MSSAGLIPEEIEAKKRLATRRRIKILSTVTVLTITVRFLVKDPAPPKNYQRNLENVQYVPGMLENIPASQLAKLDPRIIAKMTEADEKVRQPKKIPLNLGIYKPADAPQEITDDSEAQEQQLFVYKKRHKQQIMEKNRIALKAELAKPALVRFRSGGHLNAAEITGDSRRVRIRYDKTLVATLPKNLILATNGYAPNWEIPVPKGYKKLQPAEGITIVISEKTAGRISIRKKIYDEI